MTREELEAASTKLDDVQVALEAKLELLNGLRAEAEKEAEDMVHYTDENTGLTICTKCIGDDDSNFVEKILGKYVVFSTDEAQEDVYEGFYERLDGKTPVGYFCNSRNGIFYFGELRGQNFQGKMLAMFPEDAQKIVTTVDDGIAQGFSKFSGETVSRYAHMYNSQPLDGDTLVKFSNGTKLFTTVNRGELQKAGEVITINGEELKGSLVNLPPQGESFTGACSIYTGELERHTNLPQGAGVMHILTDNKTFKGKFLNGQLEGPGTYIDESTGEEFRGYFRKGRVEGNGTHHLPGKFLYEGEFKGGKYNGTGKFTFEGAGAYEGEFKDGKFEGEGKMYTMEGDYLEGRFKDWNPDGELKFKNISGKEYPPEFTGEKVSENTAKIPNSDNIGRIFTDEANKQTKMGANSSESNTSNTFKNSSINKFSATPRFHTMTLPYRMPLRHTFTTAISLRLPLPRQPLYARHMKAVSVVAGMLSVYVLTNKHATDHC